MTEGIDQFSIRQLLGSGDHYLIPMYQRNYAWEEGEITQLIQDVLDKVPRNPAQSPVNYYIGTLVVFERDRSGKAVYETIDGQQRLTTLSLLVSYLRNRDIGAPRASYEWLTDVRLDFECRENSRRTFDAIFRGAFETDPEGRLTEKEINAAILNGYRIIDKVLPLKLKETGVEDSHFVEYLLERVQIMRVPVPHDTDLNHYFEVMNSRGEQLEKHEILKSRLLEVLNAIVDEKEKRRCQDCLHRVWDACSNMERYVQMGFEPEQRNRIFGAKDWGRFDVDDFDDLISRLATSGGEDGDESLPQTIDEIINGFHVPSDDSPDEEESERFNTIINFPNFLIHALRVERKDSGGGEIPLDDKRLLESFEQAVLRSSDPVASVKRFAFSLLKCKFLLDQFVIKREFIKGSDGWSLKKMKWSDGGTRSRSGRAYYANTFGEEYNGGETNRRILMLLSAFHVSTPTMVYKHWLNAALMHLFHSDVIDAQRYLNYLESVAKSFVFDRFLKLGNGLDYYEIIFRNGGNCQSMRGDFTDAALNEAMSFGKIENNLLFNFLDYLLWLRESDPKVKAYEFTFRSSVEHYYPQNPKPGFDRLPNEVLNDFGNLCLISHSKNSTLSNFMPAAKKEYYEKSPIDSIKQHLMMKEEPWNANAIQKHGQQMKQVLLESLISDRERESSDIGSNEAQE